MSSSAKFHLEILKETKVMITEIKHEFVFLRNPFKTYITVL